MGRDELSSIVHKEMDEEAKYLATLFQKVSHDAQLVLSGQVIPESVLLAGQGIMGDAPTADGDGENSNQQNPRQLATEQEPPPPVAAAAVGEPPKQQAQPFVYHEVDFSKLKHDQHHAIVIPYRDRSFHLEQFIEHMGPYLKRNFPNDTFELWLIEQDDKFLFNRAWLANVGIANIQLQNRNYKLQLTKQQQAYHMGKTFPLTVPPPPRCVILHDVDLIPTVDGVPYTNCSRPIQLGSELAHFNNSIPYPIYTGGVGPSMLLQHWTQINGMSNDFYGWGGEDDELWHRLRLNMLLKKPVPRPIPPPDPKTGEPYKGPKFWPPEIVRPPKGKGRFRPISEAETVHHNEKNHNQWNRIGYMLEQMQNNSARWKRDGLSDLKMTITGDATTVTHMDSIQVHNHSVINADPTVSSTSRVQTTTMTQKHYVTAKQPGSVISSLSIEPHALASFVAIHHIKAIPKLTALEFIHVTQTDGSRIERAGAAAGIAWGACHYRHALEKEMSCPDRSDPEWEGRAKMHNGRETQDPWHSPLQDFEENPFGGRPTFAVVRNPYQRLIEFFYCPWNGYKGNDVSARSLNHFIQNALFPEQFLPKRKDDEPPPVAAAFEHLRPQFHYVFANNKISTYSKPFVTHVLRYENLEEDFGKLMHLYDLDRVKLPDTPLKEAPPRPVVLTAADFDLKTLKQIHKFYAGDFGRFRYRQIKTTASGSAATTKERPIIPPTIEHRPPKQFLTKEDFPSNTEKQQQDLQPLSNQEQQVLQPLPQVEG